MSYVCELCNVVQPRGTTENISSPIPSNRTRVESTYSTIVLKIKPRINTTRQSITQHFIYTQ